ncbi:MAG: hypothetical protein M0Z40_12470, partial [Actinomycetota bacterium]|nr:hypothetical protein [Actinomycetota bacterium]
MCICDQCVALCSQVIEGKPSSVPQVAPWEAEATLEDVLPNLAPVASAATQVEESLTAWVSKARSLGVT